MLGSFTPQGFTLVKNPYYWQASSVKVPKVYFPVYTSNTGALSALFSGQIDWTGNFIPGLQKSFVDTSPSTPPLLGSAGRHQQPDAEPEQVADQPAGRPAGHQRGDQPHGHRLRGRGRPGEPRPQCHRPDPAHLHRLERPGRQHDGLGHGQCGRGEVRSWRRPATPWADGYFSKNGQAVTIAITDPSAFTDYARMTPSSRRNCGRPASTPSFVGPVGQRLDRRRRRR